MSLRSRCSILLAALLSAGVLAASSARADLASCIASSEHALALRRAGKLLETRVELAECAAASCPDEVRSDCAKRMEAVNASMPSVVVAAKDASGHDLQAADVDVDGVRVASTLDGRPVEIDPGEHLLRVGAPGLPPEERKIVVGEGDKARRESFTLGAAAAPLAAPSPAMPGRGLGLRRTLAIAGGAGGLAGVGLGVTFGLLASSDWSSAKGAVTSQATCSSAAACPAHATALSDHSSAETFATASTVAFGVGGALLVAGAVTWFTARPPAAPPASARGFRSFKLVPDGAPGRATLSVVGAF